MKLNKKRITIFAYLLLLTSFAANIAVQGTCTTIGQGCCLVTQVGTTSTPDTVPGGLSISSQGCLSLLQTSSNIATYPINQTTCGLEAVLPLTPFSISLTGPSGLSYSPDGNCLLAFDGGEGIVQPFSSINCILSAAGLSPFLAFNVNSVAISSLKCVTIGRCVLPATGTMVNCNLNITNFPSLAFSKLAYSPDGTCLAAIDCSTPTNILTFSVNPDCTLSSSPVSTQPLAGAVDLAFSPTSNCLVVVSATSPNFISHVTSYSFNPANCTISSPQTITGVGVQPTQLSISPDGNCIAIADESSPVADESSPVEEGILEIYSLNSANCSLALVQTCTPNSSELGRSVGWSPNGNCLYFVTNANIYAYSRVSQPVATLSATPSTVCVGSSITLNAGPTGPGYSYVFSTPNRGMITTPNPTLVIANVTALDSGTYSVVVSLNGCASEPASTSVSVIPCNTTLAIFECCSKRISSCDVIDYIISIKNTGPVATSNLQVVDLLPSCVTFLSGSGAGWSFTSSGQTVTATLSNATPLLPGASTTLTIKAQASCASGQKITNTVTATATNVVVPQSSSCCTKVD